jgi:hypothetical protein
VTQNQERKQAIKGQGRNHTQINGGDRLRVVSKKCLPTLQRRRSAPYHVFGDRRLGNLKPQHQEFTMDPGRAPLRVFLAHPLNASWPCRCHADYFVLHGTFSGVQIVLIFIGFLARQSE